MENPKELWYFLVNAQRDARIGVYGNFYTYGDHLGDALRNTFVASAFENFHNPNLIEACKLDHFDVIENKDGLIKISETVYMRNSTHTFPYEDPDKEFQPPCGIVKATGDDEYDYDLITESFTAYDRSKDDLFLLELIVGKDSIEAVFLSLIDSLHLTDGFSIFVLDHWDNSEIEFWKNNYLSEKKAIINFLKDYSNDTLKNGHIKMVVYSSVGETNLTLDDHKKIQISTKDEDVFINMISIINKLGYNQVSDLYNLEWGFNHWHYRPAESLCRTAFVNMLIDKKFERLE